MAKQVTKRVCEGDAVLSFQHREDNTEVAIDNHGVLIEQTGKDGETDVVKLPWYIVRAIGGYFKSDQR